MTVGMKIIIARAIALTLMAFDAARSEQERDELRAEAMALTAQLAD
jgi:hypothetical protein